MKLEDFTDATELLGGGIFLLLAAGQVVYVGKSSRPMLARIANLRSKDRPRWMPTIRFDQVLIRFVHPDRIDLAYADLVATYRPRYNTDFVLSDPLSVLERRV